MQKKPAIENRESNTLPVSDSEFRELMDYYSLKKIITTNPTAAMEKVMQGISINKIKDRIRRFDQTRPSLNYSNAQSRIKDVLMVNHGLSAAATFGLDCRSMIPGTVLWRSRVVEEFKPTLTESDFWAPPDNRVARDGRVNQIGQGVLYTSAHPSTTAIEVRSKAGDKILSISYELTNTIDLMWVDAQQRNIGYSGETFKKIEKINKFLAANLRRVGSEAYVFSAIFANYFLPRECGGWFYNSTLDSTGKNYCFKPERVENKISLLKVYAFQCLHDGQLGELAGVYKKSDNGDYKHCNDRNFALQDWNEFVAAKKGDGSSGDQTSIFDRIAPYTPAIISV